MEEHGKIVEFRDTSELIVPTMLPLKEVSARTGLRYEFLRQLCLKGEIVHIRAGVKFLINWERFVEYLNGNKGGEAM